MTQRSQFVNAVLLLTLCLSISACVSSRVEQLGNRYEQVTYKTRSILFEPDSYRVTLQYRDANGKRIMIWPYLGAGPVIHNDIAVFRGSPDYLLFAVRASGPLLEISGPVLRQWAKDSGNDFTGALNERGGVHYLEQGNGLEIRFTTWNQEKVVRLDWNRIAEIMHEVEEKGIARKDSPWNVTYLEEVSNPAEEK